METICAKDKCNRQALVQTHVFNSLEESRHKEHGKEYRGRLAHKGKKKMLLVLRLGVFAAVVAAARASVDEGGRAGANDAVPTNAAREGGTTKAPTATAGGEVFGPTGNNTAKVNNTGVVIEVEVTVLVTPAPTLRALTLTLMSSISADTLAFQNAWSLPGRSGLSTMVFSYLIQTTALDASHFKEMYIITHITLTPLQLPFSKMRGPKKS